MIYLEAENWYEAWTKLNVMFCKDADVIDEKHGSRAFSIHNDVIIRSNELADLKIETVGYTKYKLQLFKRNYIRPAELDRCLQILQDRHVDNKKSYAVVSYAFAQSDKAHSMGSCVINILILVTKIKGKYHVDFECNMRIAEVTKRLLVDFIFFQEIIAEVLALFEAPTYTIVYRSMVIYAEPLTALIAAQVIPGISWEGDHWYHEVVRRQKDKLGQDSYKFKRGKRIRNYLNKLEADND